SWIPLLEIWKSDDGFNWTLVNNNPPYNHGAMVVVFDDYMYAFDGRGFRSKDGVHWEQISSDTPTSERIAVFNNSLWILKNESIFRSDDGVVWEKILAHVPWEDRTWPAFMPHNGKLWMFGGNDNYKTGNDIYFT